jgi:hypothetical protein
MGIIEDVIKNKEEEIKNKQKHPVYKAFLDMSEEAYRGLKAIHYSQLSNYYSNGYKTLFEERKINDSMIFGSLVDCLFTDSINFSNKFKVMDTKLPTEGIMKVINLMLEKNPVSKFEELTNLFIIQCCNEVDYGKSYKDETKVKYISDYSTYYNFRIESRGKQVISFENYELAIKVVEALKRDEKITELLKYNENTDIIYQAKVLTGFGDKQVKCMFDIIKLDFTNKTITPIDLKTSSNIEDNFELNFYTYNYWIQATLYSENLRLKLDELGLQEWSILPFEFIVINKENRQPLIWTFENNILGMNERLQSPYGKPLPKWQDIMSEVLLRLQYGEMEHSMDVINQNNRPKVRGYNVIAYE